MRTTHRVVGCLVGALVLACSDGTAPPTGAMRLEIATLGVDLDTDGYGVTVDAGNPLSVTSGTVVVGGLAPGLHTVRLGGAAANCAPAQPIKLVTIVADDTTDVGFTVTCGSLVGTVSVILQVNGGQFDADGFTIALDQGAPRATGVRTQAFLDSVRVGPHTVQLGGLAPNCTAPQLERSVTVAYSTTAIVTFQITCQPVFGSLRVRASTGGADIDPDGYVVDLNDDSPTVSLGPNAEVTLQKFANTTYSVRLTDIAPNCTVNGSNPRNVVLADGQISDVVFELSCAAMATLRVTLSASGPDLDPNGYDLKVTRASFQQVTAAAITGVTTVPRLLAGEYTISVEKVAANCEVTSQHPRVVTLVGGTTTDVSFDVACVAARQIAFTKAVEGNYDIWSMLSNGTAEARLTTREQVDAEPTWSPDGSKIAFRSERDGNWEIYVMSSSGADQVRLTNSASADFGPKWSPLGTRIAYVSDVGAGNYDIFSMNPDGTNVVNISNTPGIEEHPAWSPDGGKIAFRNGDGDIWVMDANGSNRQRLTSTVDWDGQPAWSPDGSRIAFTRMQCDPYCVNNIMIMNADGSGVVRITSTMDESEPAWSPDGQRIMFMGRVCDYYYYYYCSAGTVTIMKPDGTARAEISTGEVYNPAWRP